MKKEIELLKHNESDTVFDDYTIKEDKHYWSQMCDGHSKKFNYALDENVGNGTCGVVGCYKEADHYVDMFKEEVRLFTI